MALVGDMVEGALRALQPENFLRLWAILGISSKSRYGKTGDARYH